MTESWDSDPDLDLPEGPFTLLGSTSSTNSAAAGPVTGTSANGGHSALSSTDAASGRSKEGATGLAKWMDETDEEDPFERTPSSEVDATERTKEDEDESSTSSSRSSTLKGLLTSFSGLSLDATSLNGAAERSPRSDSISSHSSSASTSTTLPSTPRPSSSRRTSSPNRTPVGFTTLRHNSQLSTLIASANAGPGRVHHLGSTPQGSAKSVLGDWDEDLDFDSLDERGLPLERAQALRSKSSFASHISDDVEGDAFLESASRGLPTPQSTRRSSTDHTRSGRLSTSDFTDNEEDGFEVESDFELPDEVSRIALTPLLARASNSSLSAAHSRTSSASVVAAPPAVVAILSLPGPTIVTRAPSRHSTASPGLSVGATTTDDDDDEDSEAFFEEIVLPPYFLGGPGAMTPPSDGEGRFGVKIDLQAMLKRKLEARGGKLEGEKEGRSNGKLDGYREGDDEDAGGEEGLVIEVGVKLGEERMRTRSGPKPPALLKSRRAASVSSTLPAARSKVPPLPRSSSAFALTSIARQASATLSRSGSATSLPALAATTATLRAPHSSALTNPSPGPSPNRPSSAAGHVERAPRAERKGPPPAPSTAARDRVRTRTVSLQASSGDLRGTAAGMQTPQAGPKRPPRLEMERPGARTGSPVLSPLPMTPATPSTNTRPTLRSKRSQGNLLATPSTGAAGTRTMERKRSLQTLPRLELHAGTPNSASTVTSKRPLRSPTPSTPSGSSSNLSPFFSPAPSSNKGRPTTATSSFAAPTAASISRVRERVFSNPVLPPSSPLVGSASPQLGHPPRPSSAASGRLLLPTASSAAKASSPHPVSRPTSTLNTSLIAGLRIPAQSLKLARPKRQRAYGDGTELDAFDDLPLTKSERERERTVSMGMKRTASGGSTIKGGGGAAVKTPSDLEKARARRAANRSGGSTASTSSSSNARGERGSTVKASRPSAGGTLKKVASVAQLAPPSSASTKRGKAESAEEGAEKKLKVGEKKRRKEPHLIRNLGPPGVAKVHGEMTWNPTLHRWEGNESVLRDFDKALASSTRPALITQLSSNFSPNRVNFPSLTPSTDVTAPSPVEYDRSPLLSVAPSTSATPILRHGSSTSNLSAPNVKVVGSMVFDPISMSWHSIAADGEDELDLMFEGSDWADDEGDGRAPSSLGGGGGVMDDAEDGWAQGEKERTLKNQASFVLSDGGGGEAEEPESRRALRVSCAEGEKRHRDEMLFWTRREQEGDEEEMRESLYDIRALIMDSRTPPR